MKNLLIVYPSINTGGIETLILRFGHYYRSHGRNLKVLLTVGGGQLIDELNNTAEVKTVDYHPFSITKKRITNDPFFENIDEVFAMFPDENWMALKIASILNTSYKVGVYHPEDYGKLTNFFYRKLFDLIPDSCKLFMNVDCLKSHEIIYGRRIQSEIWQLPVIFDEHTGKAEHVTRQMNKIISVGRFDPFKTYNLTMIDVVKRFQNKGVDLVYELYGYGLLEEKMRGAIKKNRLEDRVFMKGIMKYSELPERVKMAMVFVGCGTAAIEAAYAGVPVIISAIGTDNISNGFFSDEIGFNVGEETKDLRTYQIDELLETVLSLNEQQYQALCQKHTETALERYSAKTVFKKFFNLPEIKVNLNATLKFWIAAASLYYFLPKLYKKFTRKTGLHHLKKYIKSKINRS